jgi:hypothetical protein
MQKWNAPPISKVYEALGAVADGRVISTGTNSAKVTSSSGDKFYTVEWNDAFEWITSNDNASYWVGYVGYPIIAVLLKENKISFNPAVAEALKGIPWKKINSKYKNKYDKTIAEVLETIEKNGTPSRLIIDECERIAGEINKLNLLRPDQKKKCPPPPQQKELL